MKTNEQMDSRPNASPADAALSLVLIRGFPSTFTQASSQNSFGQTVFATWSCNNSACMGAGGNKMKIESKSSAAQSRKVEEGLKGRARTFPVDLLGIFAGKKYLCVYVCIRNDPREVVL